MTIVLRIIFFLLVCSFLVGISPVWDLPVQAATSYYSIQLSSFPDEKSAVQFYEKIKSLPQAQIERIGKYYTARIGVWRDRSDAVALLTDVRTISPGATVRKAFYRKERLIVPDSVDAPGAASGMKLLLHRPSQERAKATPEPSSSPQPPAKNGLKRLRPTKSFSIVSNWETSPPKQTPNGRTYLSEICLILA